jgi:hypothetical protein
VVELVGFELVAILHFAKDAPHAASRNKQKARKRYFFAAAHILPDKSVLARCTPENRRKNDRNSSCKPYDRPLNAGAPPE